MGGKATMINISKSIQKCNYSQQNDKFKLVMLDRTGNKKLGDGFDSSRDLVSYYAKYDENQNIKLKIKLEKYQPEAFEQDSSIVILLDFLKDYGTYTLPFNIKGATDHWWEISYSIKNNKLIQQVSSDIHNKNPQIISLDEINYKESEINLTIDTQKLKELGWSKEFPLYIQILTNKGEIITDSFNDPKPYENANFLVGAMPINKFLEYNNKCFEIHK